MFIANVSHAQSINKMCVINLWVLIRTGFVSTKRAFETMHKFNEILK